MGEKKSFLRDLTPEISTLTALRKTGGLRLVPERRPLNLPDYNDFRFQISDLESAESRPC